MDLSAARTLGLSLLREHGLHDWTLVFDNAKARFGVCRDERRQIGLSRRLTSLSTEDDVRETLLHEIAHALVGKQHGHNEVWRRTAVSIGASGERCGERLPGSEGPWEGRCPNGHVSHQHKRPTRVKSCGLCSPGFDPTLILDWTYRGQPAPMLGAYLDELASIQDKAGLPRTAATAGRQTAVTMRPGAQVVITGDDRYAGLTGVVARKARTRYHVHTSQGVLTVPPGRLRPLDDTPTGETTS